MFQRNEINKISKSCRTNFKNNRNFVIRQEFEELSTRKIQTKNNTSTSLIEIKSKNQNLTFRTLKTFYKNNNLSINSDTFKKDNYLTTKNGKYNVLAELLADMNRYAIKIFIFDGKTISSNIISYKTFQHKCLLQTMLQIQKYFINEINKIKTTSKKAIKTQIDLFDINAFVEALSNACIHNCWATEKSPIVFVFSNRLEIISIGGLNNISKEDFIAGKSRSLNPELLEIFTRLGCNTNSGSGIKIIQNRYTKSAFSIFDDSIKVTIPFNYIPTQNLKLKSATKTRFRIIELINQNKNITRSELAKQLGVSKNTVKYHINRLENKI